MCQRVTDFAVTLPWAVYDCHTVGLLACVIVILNVTEPQPCDKQGNRLTSLHFVWCPWPVGLSVWLSHLTSLGDIFCIHPDWRPFLCQQAAGGGSWKAYVVSSIWLQTPRKLLTLPTESLAPLPRRGSCALSVNCSSLSQVTELWFG